MANPQKPDPSGVLLVRKYVELAAKLNTYLNHWPHHEKYGLAQQVRTTLYDCYKLMDAGRYKAVPPGEKGGASVVISEPCHRFASVYGPHTLAAARLSSPAPAS